MNKLDNLVKNNINNKGRFNYAIEYEPKFDIKFSWSSGTKDPLPVVTVSLQLIKKHRATIISGTTCLWDRGATYIMIKRWHTKPYDRKMRSNKV